MSDARRPSPTDGTADAAGTITPQLLARARQARQLRATMSAFLPQDLLVDTAWDMMIDLFIAAGTGAALHVKDLILLSGESAASAMRRIDRLQAAALIERDPDPSDHRRVRVRLTTTGRTAMIAMLEHLFDAPGSGTRTDGVTPRSFRPALTRR